MDDEGLVVTSTSGSLESLLSVWAYEHLGGEREAMLVLVEVAKAKLDLAKFRSIPFKDKDVDGSDQVEGDLGNGCNGNRRNWTPRGWCHHRLAHQSSHHIQHLINKLLVSPPPSSHEERSFLILLFSACRRRQSIALSLPSPHGLDTDRQSPTVAENDDGTIPTSTHGSRFAGQKVIFSGRV